MLASIRNFFAFVGVLAVAGIVYTLVKLGPIYQEFHGFDSKALPVYQHVVKQLLATGSLVDSTIIKIPVADGVTAEQVEATMKSVATEHNIKEVGELPLSSDVQTITGQNQPYSKIFMFANVMAASRMTGYNAAYSAYLPYRITLLADSNGKLWLYAYNMDTVIFGGKPFPPDLREEAINMRMIMRDIMKRGAEGKI